MPSAQLGLVESAAPYADASQCLSRRASCLQQPLYLGFCSLAPPIRLERNSTLPYVFFLKKIVFVFALLQKGSLQGQELTHSFCFQKIS